jgi:hypothetical protein
MGIESEYRKFSVELIELMQQAANYTSGMGSMLYCSQQRVNILKKRLEDIDEHVYAEVDCLESSRPLQARTL